ncbi:MAG TPA: chitobiase/beta-hexosaminidase C-terminal domain-containing protein, partial [Candidatus Competibacteraceae bacterium]|nr:chitobiase/beta-hexosaminidase C-terminal domain-containing protein [Candidatus Competibacteraceae bacterium]
RVMTPTIFNQVVGVITLDEFGGAPPPLVPRGVAVSTDGNRLYVTDGAGSRLFIIDIIANHAVVSIVPTGQKPYGVSASPYIGTEDGQPVYQVYVANETDNTVSVIKDGPNNQAEVIATIPVGQDPWAFGQFVGPLATVAAPTFAPPGGAYQSGVKVTISTTTSGAAIRYTTDGSTPTSTSGTLIESGQTILVTTSGVSGTVVLKAVAFKEGWADSAVTEASYQINRQF